jgi:DNA-binding response OmpR family regulator
VSQLPANEQPLRIIVVDDEPDVGAIIAQAARDVGLEPMVVSSAREFDSLRRQHPPDIIALDVVIPEVDGIEVVRRLADEECRVPLLLFSGYPDYLPLAVKLARARGLNLVADFTKPFDTTLVTSVLEQARARARAS